MAKRVSGSHQRLVYTMAANKLTIAHASGLFMGVHIVLQFLYAGAGHYQRLYKHVQAYSQCEANPNLHTTPTGSSSVLPPAELAGAIGRVVSLS